MAFPSRRETAPHSWSVTNQHDALAAAVERLVQPFRVPTMQTAGDRTWLTVVDHAPLLTQLRGAIVGGTGHHPGGATSEAHTRLPFDAGAQAIYANIDRIVRTWCRAAALPVKPAEPLESALVAWHRHYWALQQAGSLTPESYARRAARIERWCEQIEALFDPPTLVPLRGACPTCERERVVNADGEHVLALVVEYWKHGEQVTRTNARCRAADCMAEWLGWNGVEALVKALDTPQREVAHEVAEALAEGDAAEAEVIEHVLTGQIPVIDHALLAAAERCGTGQVSLAEARASFDEILRGEA